jgi:hypothetical protein
MVWRHVDDSTTTSDADEADRRPAASSPVDATQPARPHGGAVEWRAQPNSLDDNGTIGMNIACTAVCSVPIQVAVQPTPLNPG